MQLDERHWDLFYRDLRAQTGLDLALYKQEQTRRRLVSLAKSMGCETLLDFGRELARDPEGVSKLLDHLAINVTSMFRNPEKWRVLEQEVLPELLQRAPSLSVWSAGCSHGSEPYSLAALLQATRPGLHRILATDVDPGALRCAREGLFSPAALEALPRPELRAMFEPADGVFRANAVLRRTVAVVEHNLLSEPPRTGFDLILCRNVTIYFNEEAKAMLYRRFYSALREGGYLLIGNTERIFDSREIGFEAPYTCFYRKPGGGAGLWRNAS
ncbi:MAG: protein-glutamate O-methyltransferase CheR [Fimbriimonadaceae bacterium]|nr:protein-glutamate O-methyltransferase CheR [Chthonomonadaceae bacterium]MCO5295853.1 protein-glutamate O-methyltransferase CheR [Fimbriimonadaceae bacterium]